MLECTNCGAVGESFFSANFFGEMVCELCGTQSFLQARNETQDAEDMGIDVTRVHSTLKRRSTRKRRGERKARSSTKQQKTTKQKPADVQLSDCLIASQMILDFQARALVNRVGVETFPPEYVRVVKQLWFQLLETWGTKGEIPLLRCFTEFFMPTRETSDKMDPAITTDLLEQWDADREKEKGVQEREKKEQEKRERRRSQGEETKAEGNDNDSSDEDSVKSEIAKKKAPKKTFKPAMEYHLIAHCRKLDRFSIVDLLALLMLASRVLSLGLLPSDFANWVASGVLPYHNLLATCCADAPDIQDAVEGVAIFFNSVLKAHNVSSARIAYHAHYLQHHMGLRLPPLNVPLAAHRLCGVLGFPGEVFRNFQWIAGFFNVEGDQPELPLLLHLEAMNPKTGQRTPRHSKAYVQQLLSTEIGIIAHLTVAVRMCAGWEEWVFERLHDTDARTEASPPTAMFNPALLLRRDLDAFVKLCDPAFVKVDGSSGIPEDFQDHVDKLKALPATNEMLAPENDPRSEDVASFSQHQVYSYPAIHVDGVLAETDDDIEQHVDELRYQEANGDATSSEEKDPTFFYPKYAFGELRQSAMHAPFENLLELLCQQVDTPIASVFLYISDLDLRVERLCKSLTFTSRKFQAVLRYNPMGGLAIDAPKWKNEAENTSKSDEHKAGDRFDP